MKPLHTKVPSHVHPIFDVPRSQVDPDAPCCASMHKAVTVGHCHCIRRCQKMASFIFNLSMIVQCVKSEKLCCFKALYQAHEDLLLQHRSDKSVCYDFLAVAMFFYQTQMIGYCQAMGLRLSLTTMSRGFFHPGMIYSVNGFPTWKKMFVRRGDWKIDNVGSGGSKRYFKYLMKKRVSVETLMQEAIRDRNAEHLSYLARMGRSPFHSRSDYVFYDINIANWWQGLHILLVNGWQPSLSVFRTFVFDEELPPRNLLQLCLHDRQQWRLSEEGALEQCQKKNMLAPILRVFSYMVFLHRLKRVHWSRKWARVIEEYMLLPPKARGIKAFPGGVSYRRLCQDWK